MFTGASIHPRVTLPCAVHRSLEREEMIGQTISHYKILEELGAGGMGVLYKALDTRLDREVAIKFLPPQLKSDKDARTRFVHEAKAASALNHSNIAVIHEIDETPDGQMFIVMAYYEGQTLKDKLEGGALGVDEAIAIVSQIASGLSKAHEKDILHRDIKPANILLGDDGQAKLADFGLAKLAGPTQVTKTGTTVGTVAYMSPEQARGEEVTPQTDVFSLGVVLYEMVTGRWPFRGEYDQAIMYSIVNEDPQPITAADDTLPAELERIVSKAMAKTPAQRYQSATDMLRDLKSLREGAGVGALTVGTSNLHPTRSIAVLPFVNMSDDDEQEYFCDGIAEDIINDLTHIKELRVAARTSAFAFKGRTVDVREIGKKLNVEVLLEGSVRKAGNRLRITAQLVNVADGYHLWAERYDRELSDVFAIQAEIAHNIVRSLEIKLSQTERQALEKAPTGDVVAYDFYLRGRRLFHQKRPTAIRQAIEMFTHAINKDPDYAAAYAGIADCYSYVSLFEDKEACLEKSFKAGLRALELDPELAEAYASRGLTLSLSGRHHDEVDKAFETAIRLNPGLFEAYYFYGYSCRIQQRWEKAAQLFEQAAVISPADYQTQNHLGMAYKSLSRRAEAEVAYRRSLENIERYLELNPEDSRAYQMGAVALIELGEREKGLQWGRKAVPMDPENPMLLYNSACVFSVAGDIERALECFERAIETGYSNKGAALSDPDLDPIRSHRRFQNLIRRLE